MAARQLTTRRVEKPWGRRDLLPPFGIVAADAEPVGEIWFEDGDDDRALLVKYLFTSERLSIQVHPDDEAARAAGHRCGKDEAWVVLAAEPGATIGIGLRAPASREELRAAALDGRIEEMVDWRPAKAGDIYYSPAGTIHALGAGLTLIEVQPNVDVTYRLYDYGRPRELHLDQGIAVCAPAPYEPPFAFYEAATGRLILAEGPAFVLERRTAAGPFALDGEAWLIPISGSGSIDGETLAPGTAWCSEGHTEILLGESCDLLVAYSGARLR